MEKTTQKHRKQDRINAKASHRGNMDESIGSNNIGKVSIINFSPYLIVAIQYALNNWNHCHLQQDITVYLIVYDQMITVWSCFLLQNQAHPVHPDITPNPTSEGLYICIHRRYLFGLTFNFQSYFIATCKRECKWGVKLQKYKAGEIHNQKSPVKSFTPIKQVN